MRSRSFMDALWLFLTLGCIALTLLLTLLPLRERGDTKSWKEAAAHIKRKFSPGEVVVVHPAGDAAAAMEHLAGLPTICDPRKKNMPLDSLRASGLWIIGTKKPDGRLKKAKSAWGKSAEALYTDVFLNHYWKPKARR